MIFTKGTTLYHASYTEVFKPNLAVCILGKDFGRGFYLTTDYKQAKLFTQSSIGKAKAEGRIDETHNTGFITEFIVEDEPNIKYIEYPEANVEWLECVVAHRKEPEVDTSKWARFDAIAGKIANDNTNFVITAYIRGAYGETGSNEAAATAIRLLEPENSKDQVCLRTEDALACIKYIKTEEV